MSDDRERLLAERIASAFDTSSQPDGWGAICERAAELRAQPWTTADAVRMKPPRRRVLGGAIAVGVMVAIVGTLFVAGLPGRRAPSAGPVALPATIRYLTNQTERFTTRRGRVEESINVEHDVDLRNGTARHWAVDWPLDLVPPMVEERIVTAEYVYVLIPRALPAAAGGKRWLRYPTGDEWANELDMVRRLEDPLETAPRPPVIADPPSGTSFPPSGWSSYYTADDTVDGALISYTYWVDASDRLLRSTQETRSKVDDAPQTYSTEVLGRDITLEDRRPALSDVLTIASRDEAAPLLGSAP